MSRPDTTSDLFEDIDTTRHLRDPLIAFGASIAGAACLLAGMLLLSRWLS